MLGVGGVDDWPKTTLEVQGDSEIDYRSGFYTNKPPQWTAYASVKAVLRFKLDKSFRVGEQTSFEAMSKFSGLNVMNVRRIIRHAIINHHFFREDVPGVITHSALTAVLAGDEVMRNSLIVELDEFWPAGVKV